MKLKSILAGAMATAAVCAVPSIAQAAYGQATGSVNMRTCASVNCARITVVPAGAQVWIAGQQGNWLLVNYGNRQGYVHANYIATAYAGTRMPPPTYVQPGLQVGFFGPPPRYGYWRQPWWDSRYHAWYDGRRWYRNGIWYNDPSGLSIRFSFGN